MLTIPETNLLRPRLVNGVYTFPSDNTELVKMDLLYEAGSAYQTKKLCATAAAQMFSVATSAMDSAALSEFMDFRGILTESDCQVYQATVTFYFLRRYADDLLPVVADMLRGMAFSKADFDVWKKRRRQEMLSALQKPDAVARREYYRALFGAGHPLGRYATVDDLDILSADDVRRFFDDYYRPDRLTVVVAGAVDTMLLESVGKYIAIAAPLAKRDLLPSATRTGEDTVHVHIPNATQTAIRVGRLLPFGWESDEYARFVLLTTILGGYFGSRLMSSLREDKGYTYGIYARTQIYRGAIVFYVTANVASGRSADAVGDIMLEFEKLSRQAVPDEELQLVKTVFAGDFMRSVDGIFERSARFCDMYATGVTELLTDNLRDVMSSATAESIQKTAESLLAPSEMTVSTAGI